MRHNFKTPLDQACGDRKAIEHLQYIYFKDDFAYISNGSCHVKQHLSLHGFSGREIKHLNGNKMHREAFKIFKRQKELLIDKDAISFLIFENPITMLHKPTTDYQSTLLDQIDNLFKDWDMDFVKEIAYPPDHVAMLQKVFVTKSSGFTYRFNNLKQGILVTPNQDNYLEHAVIRPLKITGQKNDEL